MLTSLTLDVRILRFSADCDKNDLTIAYVGGP